METPKDVESYIAGALKEVRDTLAELHRAIKKAAPKANERISYGMPHYEYGGSGIAFSAFKKHISVFISPSLGKRYLNKYHATKATYHFPLNKPFPFVLIGKTVQALVKERDKENKVKQ